jgi:hypothetical protein
MSRSRATARQAGTKWESRIVDHLVAAGWPHAERRRLGGNRDRGDIAGVPGVVIEAKDTNEYRLAEALNEANKERDNDGAAYGVAWFHRHGKSTAAEGYVVMDGESFTRLLKEAGY